MLINIKLPRSPWCLRLSSGYFSFRLGDGCVLSGILRVQCVLGNGSDCMPVKDFVRTLLRLQIICDDCRHIKNCTLLHTDIWRCLQSVRETIRSTLLVLSHCTTSQLCLKPSRLSNCYRLELFHAFGWLSHFERIFRIFPEFYPVILSSCSILMLSLFTTNFNNAL